MAIRWNRILAVVLAASLAIGLTLVEWDSLPGSLEVGFPSPLRELLLLGLVAVGVVAITALLLDRSKNP